MKLKHFIFVVALSGMLSPAFAEFQSNNAVAATSTSSSVTFRVAKRTVFFSNDGSNEVYIRLWMCRSSIADITKADTQALRLDPSEQVTFSYDNEEDTAGVCGGPGFKGVSLICDTAETTTLRMFTK